MTSYLHRLKTLNSEKCHPPHLQKLQKGGEDQPEGAFYSFCSTQSAHFQKIEPLSDACHPRRLWLIYHPDGRLISHSFTPAASREGVLGWYPEALGTEPYQPSKAPPEAPLRACDEARIRAWLASIGEEDTATIEEVLENCRTDSEAADYFLGRASDESHLSTTEQ